MKCVHLAALFLLPLLLLACAGRRHAGADPASLPNVRMYNSSLGVGDYLIEITAAGHMTVQQQSGTTETDVQRSAMQLTPDQIASLQTVFKGWKKLKSDYPGEWSNLVEITYDNYTVRAHDLGQAPATFTDAMATLVKLARTAVAASTQPAASPANPSAAPAPIGSERN